MRLEIVNLSRLKVEEVRFAARAVNQQIESDLCPVWRCERSALFLSDVWSIDRLPIEPVDRPWLGSDGVIYLLDDETAEVGIHHASKSGVPWGVVNVDLSISIFGDWSSSLSHEALEMIVNPHLNRLCFGPKKDGVAVVHPVEICDPVSSDQYTSAGIPVSNFVHPSWYFHAKGLYPVDFLGRCKGPWDVAPGGCDFYFGKDEKPVVILPDDDARRVNMLKNENARARRIYRHRVSL